MALFNRKSKDEPTIAKAMVSGSSPDNDQDQGTTPNAAATPKQAEATTPATQPATQPTQPVSNNTTEPAAQHRIASQTGGGTVDDTAQQIAHIESQMQDLSVQYSHLRDGLKLRMFQLKAFFSDGLNQQQGALDRLNKQIDDLKTQIRDINNEDDGKFLAEKQEIDALLPDLQAAVDQQVAQLKAVNEQMAQLQDHATELDDKISASQAQEDQLSEAIKGETDLAKILESVEANKQQALTLVEERKQLAAQKAEIDGQISDLGEDLEAAQTNLNIKESDLHKHQDQTAAIDNQIQRAQKQRAHKLEILNQSKAKLDAQAAQVSKRVADFAADLDKVNGQIQDRFGTGYLIQNVQFSNTLNYMVLMNTNDTNDADQASEIRLFKFLNQNVSQPVTVISLKFDLQLKDHLINWAQEHQFDVPKMVNIFNELQANAESTAPVVTIHENESIKGAWDADKTHREFRDAEGNLLMVAQYQNNDQIKDIYYYDDSRLSRISTLNDQGQLSRTRTFQQDNSVVDEFFRVDGTLCLKFSSEDQTVNKVEVFDNNNLRITSFAGTEDFYYWWLEQYLKTQADVVFIGMDNDPIYRKITSSTNVQAIPYLINVSKNIGKIKATMHSDHPWHNVLVTSRHDKLLLESIADRDMNVSSVSPDSDIADLPAALQTDETSALNSGQNA
ncbi:hypothetical protein [Agrilactobacillus composti]|nr:hypothetical protein [Agrilactobacillus composti]